jgi:hypothetical protein
VEVFEFYMLVAKFSALVHERAFLFFSCSLFISRVGLSACRYAIEWSISARFVPALLNQIVVSAAKMCAPAAQPQKQKQPKRSHKQPLLCSLALSSSSMPFLGTASYYVRVRARNAAGLGPPFTLARPVRGPAVAPRSTVRIASCAVLAP